jgi:hypothetical protein
MDGVSTNKKTKNPMKGSFIGSAIHSPLPRGKRNVVRGKEFGH